MCSPLSRALLRGNEGGLIRFRFIYTDNVAGSAGHLWRSGSVLPRPACVPLCTQFPIPSRVNLFLFCYGWHTPQPVGADASKVRPLMFSLSHPNGSLGPSGTPHPRAKARGPRCMSHRHARNFPYPRPGSRTASDHPIRPSNPTLAPVSSHST